MIRSRFTRLLGFGLSLLAALLSLAASGSTLVLCEEADGCVELEFLANGASACSDCASHEHESAPARPSAPSELKSSRCDDTVIAYSSDVARSEKGPRVSLPSRVVLVVPSLFVRTSSTATSPFVAMSRSSVACGSLRTCQESIVLRI